MGQPCLSSIAASNARRRVPSMFDAVQLQVFALQCAQDGLPTAQRSEFLDLAPVVQGNGAYSAFNGTSFVGNHLNDDIATIFVEFSCNSLATVL